jgi:hypothetical protein
MGELNWRYKMTDWKKWDGNALSDPMCFPDGDIIDLYYRVEGSALIISDLGEIVSWLKTSGIEDIDRDFIKLTCGHFGVLYKNGSLFVQVEVESLLTEETEQKVAGLLKAIMTTIYAHTY